MKKSTIIMILCIIMILLSLLSTNFYINRVDVITATKQKDRDIQVINEIEWNYITAIIDENREKAFMSSNKLSEDIEQDVREQYPDLNILKYELDNNIPNTKFSDILRDNFNGVYLNNIENDNNDPWAAMYWGVYGDFSNNCSKIGSARTWNVEVAQHWNKVLTQQAIDSILQLSDKIIFWEYLQPDKPHKMIKQMSIDSLHQIFIEEGVQGLKTYEFLNPSYITAKGDIFGIPDVGSGGMKNANDKIIIVQGFNIYDQLIKDHGVDLKNFDDRRIEINQRYTDKLTTGDITVVIQSVMIFLAILALIFVYNNLYDINAICKLIEDEKK